MDNKKRKKQLASELNNWSLRIDELERTEIERKREERLLKGSEISIKTGVMNVRDAFFPFSAPVFCASVNPEEEEIISFRPEPIIGTQLVKTTVERRAPESSKTRKRILSLRMIKNLWISRKNRKKKLGSKKMNSAPVDKEGRITGIRRVRRDVREQNQTVKDLRRSIEKKVSLLIAIPDLMFRLDRNGIFLEFIPDKEFSSWKPLREVLGRSVYDVLDKKVAGQFMQSVKQAIETGETQILEYQLSLNGKSHHYESRITADSMQDILVVVRSFTRQKQAERMAAIDPLTYTYNRRKFSELLDEEIKRVERDDRSFSIVMLDIDHFKKINDTHGHDVGDSVLRGMAKLIRENIRDKDILARYGGEEFVIILPERNLRAARAVAERIRKVIESAHFDKVGHVTISAGVSDFVQGDNRKSVFKKADNALYIAKNQGRNRVSVH